jgi:hypothetical protein
VSGTPEKINETEGTSSGEDFNFRYPCGIESTVTVVPETQDSESSNDCKMLLAETSGVLKNEAGGYLSDVLDKTIQKKNMETQTTGLYFIFCHYIFLKIKIQVKSKYYLKLAFFLLYVLRIQLMF